ncbi:hypothetical protein LAZ67_4001868, partial [Cordylochernes scorpioides]
MADGKQWLIVFSNLEWATRSPCGRLIFSSCIRLKAAIRKAKRHSCLNLCEEVLPVAWSAIHRFIARGRSSPRGPALLKHDDGSPFSPEETCLAVLNHFFLQDSRPYPRKFDHAMFPDQPDFTSWKVTRAIQRCGRRKAPGPDGLGSLFIDLGGSDLHSLLAGIFTKCLRMGHFLLPWKEGHLILLPKASNSARSYLAREFCISYAAGIKILPSVVMLARQLRSIYYTFETHIFRGDPCTPTIPAISLTGSPHFDIIIQVRRTFLKEIKEGNYESKPGLDALPYPPFRRPFSFSLIREEVTTSLILKNGSKSDSGVGAAIILPSQEHQLIILRLHTDCTAFQAELLAILWATQFAETSPTKTATIITTDCRSTLAAICSSVPTRVCWVSGYTGINGNEPADSAAKFAATSVLLHSFSTLPRTYARHLTRKAALSSWTVLYSQDHSTRSLRKIASTPSHFLKFLPKIRHGEAPTTILTGHDHVLAVITRVHPETGPTCIHCSEEPQTVDHLLFSCPAFLRHRMQTAILLGLTHLNPISMANLPDSNSAWKFLRMPGHRKRRQFKQTDAFTRGMVIGLKRAGWSIRQIAADTHLGASTVHRLWRRWLEQGNVAIYRNVGATRVTSARVDRRILRQAVEAPQATCTAILQHLQDTLDHSISTRTISRRLVANGLHSCRPLRRLPLTPPNRRQRLEWCRARSTRMTEWHRVVFSDESRFCLSSDSRRVRVWRRRGERSNPAAIVERPTVRQRGIMVWGATAYDSRSPLLRIQGTMTAQRYVDDVLRPVSLPYLQGVPNALYQQDNARPHTARISQQALQDVQMLPWPPYSPDLSPIEHVWDIIGRRLHAFPQPRSEDELWQMVEREWRAIPQDAIRTLIDSLPRRVAACIAVRASASITDICSLFWLSFLASFANSSAISLPRSQHGQESIVECSYSPMIPVGDGWLRHKSRAFQIAVSSQVKFDEICPAPSLILMFVPSCSIMLIPASPLLR